MPNRKYVDGEVTFVDLVDSNVCKLDILDTIMYQILEVQDKLFYHYKIPMKSLDIGLRSLANDNDMTEMIKHVKRHKTIYVYVEHCTSYLDTHVGPSNAIGNDNDEAENQVNNEAENEINNVVN